MSDKHEPLRQSLELPLEQLRPTPDQQAAFYREVDGLRTQISGMRAGLDELDTNKLSKQEKKELAFDKREFTQILKELDAIEEHGAKFINLREGAAYAS